MKNSPTKESITPRYSSIHTCKAPHSHPPEKDGRVRCYAYVNDLSTGRRIFCKAKDLRAAREMLNERLKGEAAPKQLSKTMTVAQFLPTFMGTKKGLDAGTLRNYESAFRTHVIPPFGNRTLESLTREDAIAWANDLSEYAGLEAWRYIRVRMNTMLDLAVESDLIPANPFRSKLVPKPGKAVVRPHPFSDHLVDRILKGIEGDPWALFYHIALQLGPRCSEILGLRVDDVNSRGRWALTNQIMPDGADGPPKTESSIRDLDMPPTLFAEYLARIAERPGQRYVFSTTRGGCVTYDTFVKTHWYPLLERLAIGCQDCGHPAAEHHRTKVKRGDAPRKAPCRNCKCKNFKGLKFHGFRHTFATRCFEDGMHPKDVSKMLGHADEAITMRIYTGWDKGSQTRVTTALEKRYGTAA